MALPWVSLYPVLATPSSHCRCGAGLTTREYPQKWGLGGGVLEVSPRAPHHPSELRSYPPPHLFLPSHLHFIRSLLDHCNTSIQHFSGDWRGPSHYLHGTGTRWGQGACLNYPDLNRLPYRLQYCLGSPKHSELHCCSPLFIKGSITPWNSYEPSDSLEDKK